MVLEEIFRLLAAQALVLRPQSLFTFRVKILTEVPAGNVGNVHIDMIDTQSQSFGDKSVPNLFIMGTGKTLDEAAQALLPAFRKKVVEHQEKLLADSVKQAERANEALGALSLVLSVIPEDKP